MRLSIRKYCNSKHDYLPIADLDVEDGKIHFEYDMNYLANHMEDELIDRVSLAIPCDFEFHDYDSWPAFLIDLIPSGYGKRYLMEKYGKRSEEFLLQIGAWNPSGDLRVVGPETKDFIFAMSSVIDDKEPQIFTEEQIISKDATFLEMANSHGVKIDGATDVQGDAPKFLIIESKEGGYCLDIGELYDQYAEKHYIVKFPRGNSERDRAVLRNEAAYYRVAKFCGIHCGNDLRWVNNALFIPRFDRTKRDGRVIRYGMESFYAAAEITERGAIMDHFEFCDLILKYSHRANEDLLDYIKRDILNSAMGNPDNHGRNSAFLKKGGEIGLAPLYDFAPMFYDHNDVYRRRTIWAGGYERAEIPQWYRINEELVKRFNVHLRDGLKDFIKVLDCLPDIMKREKVDDFIIEQRMEAITANLTELKKIK